MLSLMHSCLYFFCTDFLYVCKKTSQYKPPCLISICTMVQVLRYYTTIVIFFNIFLVSVLCCLLRLLLINQALSAHSFSTRQRERERERGVHRHVRVCVCVRECTWLRACLCTHTHTWEKEIVGEQCIVMCACVYLWESVCVNCVCSCNYSTAYALVITQLCRNLTLLNYTFLCERVYV
jgi:hypothetical protein